MIQLVFEWKVGGRPEVEMRDRRTSWMWIQDTMDLRRVLRALKETGARAGWRRFPTYITLLAKVTPNVAIDRGRVKKQQIQIEPKI